MSRPPSCPVLLCADSAAESPARIALVEAGFEVSSKGLEEASRPNGFTAQVILIDAGARRERVSRLCQELRGRGDENYVPILLLTNHDASARRAALESGADAVLAWPGDSADLIAQVHALARIKQRHDLLAAKAAEAQRSSKRLQAAYHQIDQELELARRVQQSFLPQSLPQVPGVRLAVEYRPSGHVGGDFYDVFRLDEQHLGLYVADAMGHGVPASLLTIFVKTSVKPKEITGQSYRLVPPDEVLHALNRELIKQALSEMPFITMAYALFNWQTGTLQFARAGHPYPLLVPRAGPPTLLQVEGSLLGVFDTRYRIQSQTLQPGDKLLLYTDGIDAASFGTQPVGLPSLLAAAESYRRLPIDELVGRLASDLFAQTRQTDDLTVLGLEMLMS